MSLRSALRPLIHTARGAFGTLGLSERLNNVEVRLAEVLQELHADRAAPEPVLPVPEQAPTPALAAPIDQTTVEEPVPPPPEQTPTPPPAEPIGPKAVGMAEAMEIIDKSASMSLIDQNGYLSNYTLRLDTSPPVDPYSPEYREFVLDLWRQLSGRSDYAPIKDEIYPDLRSSVGTGQPGPYFVGTSDWVGHSWVAWGFIMQQMNLVAGQRVIEYGIGHGAMSIALARLGCDVTVVDIEPAYLEWVALQAKQVGVNIRTVQGTFGVMPPGAEPYDAVIFLESFHHCLNHFEVLQQLQDQTTDTGIVCLGDEPVFQPDDFWASTVPFPWGPRLDLVSLNATKLHGWLELGFREDYLLETMRRAGWEPTRYTCPLTRRGTCHIGRKPALR